MKKLAVVLIFVALAGCYAPSTAIPQTCAQARAEMMIREERMGRSMQLEREMVTGEQAFVAGLLSGRSRKAWETAVRNAADLCR